MPNIGDQLLKFGRQITSDFESTGLLCHLSSPPLSCVTWCLSFHLREESRPLAHRSSKGFHENACQLGHRSWHTLRAGHDCFSDCFCSLLKKKKKRAKNLRAYIIKRNSQEIAHNSQRSHRSLSSSVQTCLPTVL